ncbi:TPA: hypothetical protein ACQGUY_006225 [Pseudomonas aeruginosa]|uniref:hypothetical protein n=1 Tax=Pseudomonas aeruginosa TaxID=287 RepID=UPI000F547A77|nr:hypothetical protein [Pseudomonas aeruginosa]EIU2643099.1 hypothetical protein [Pseudomonas aeruginosa]EIU4982362.1 hypothetical protein [Pseudomonas aeruginosa]EIU9544641.1 hypothetical protein [Pseudomonas aeruginosa]EIU9551416.1 hypothetical protein [Pseudomonas aeruginosa]EIY2512994.1 hypothetical protein [Pseudomonas aeruginosa]
MSDDRYVGWQPLIEALCQACEPFAIVPHAKPKTGRWQLSCPRMHPSSFIELRRRLSGFLTACANGAVMEER